MAIIGAHVSTAGGLAKAIARGEEIGAEAIQIFGSSPRQWGVRMPSEQDIAEFRAAFKSSKIKSVFLHACYLANLAAPDAASVKKSIEALTAHLAIAEKLEAEGLIFHVGSTKGGIEHDAALRQIAAAMNQIVKNVPGKAKLIMENGSGGGNKVGSEPKDLRALLDLAKNPRIAVCIDTAHAFGANQFNFEKWDAELGLKNVIVVHANDSKVPLGSFKDRHENIGEGEIGRATFKKLLAYNHLKNLPWLLEVPGFDNMGPDKKNVDILKSLIK
ncbi:hypothetical protein COV82_04215 [Candidatus Peregrinibacteria bacterium CG11_big_fil_rev_8_21_14_0_20_46_8]|nr:MAG: hypothetical protein COV82_04215 [Candidatus Peregrinibacteria bacterium CG11_big_fil_rev_8_21_14_0_20_46_8]